MEKGMKSKKHEPLGRSSKRVGLEMHWMADEPAGGKEYNLEFFTLNSLTTAPTKRNSQAEQPE
ncbi:hypothetical protein IGI04_040584 [Brassica rapa subsp. trilocularis]|uniref:Uncharacterized protein n=1 Tax=Brassica rapa subsp. trilocularis TaxID=1813537 RepID=A0ABQ7KSF7_BRACM|nr:hypothetical protein IGI04_040584 [Brassica rapa subsp. trilocularis]